MKYFNIFKHIIKNSDLKTIDFIFELLLARIEKKIGKENLDVEKLEKFVQEAIQILDQEPYKNLSTQSKEKIFVNLILEKLLTLRDPKLATTVLDEADNLIEEFLK